MLIIPNASSEKLGGTIATCDNNMLGREEGMLQLEIESLIKKEKNKNSG